MQIFKFSIPLFSLYFVVASCTKSTPASKVTDISDIKAEIEIYQSLSDQNDNMVSIVLYDKKNKEIVNDSINIWVNGKQADYKAMPQLYSIKNYYYRIEKVHPENGRYDLQIHLPNGKKFPLGSGSTITLSNPDNIIYKGTTLRNKDYTIQWSHLYDVNRLSLFKSIQVENKQDPTITTFLEEPSDTIGIGPDGSYLIQKEKLAKPNEKLRIMIFKFTANTKGDINPNLLKGSTFNIRGSYEKQVQIE